MLLFFRVFINVCFYMLCFSLLCFFTVFFSSEMIGCNIKIDDFFDYVHLAMSMNGMSDFTAYSAFSST